MLWVPQKGKLLTQHNLPAVGTNPLGTSVTTGASESTKGTPAEIFASTSFDAYWMTIIVGEYAVAGGASQGALDVLIGAATEEVLIPNLLIGYAASFDGSAPHGPRRWDFPLYIPAGSRIAVQAAGIRLSTALRVMMFLHGGDGLPKFRVGSKVTTYGMGTVPNGTSITPGVSGAEGAWTEITASTTEDHFALMPSFQISGDSVIALKSFALDLGLGAATEEEIANYYYSGNVSEGMQGPMPSWPVFQDVPSGTRLVMRASNSGTNDAAYNAVIHGVN